ncbi:hypothetical protein ABPG77_008583 [Micractinium sp. CCAP 211/92]
MRQLADLLNSFAGTAARLPSGLPLTTSPGVPGSRGSMGAWREAGPPPLSAAAAAAFPALRAAEAALEAKLADNAAACVADYVRLHVLNERLGARRSFRAAEACRGLNRYCDVLPYDDNRVRLGQPAFAGFSSGGVGGAGCGGAPPGGQPSPVADSNGPPAAAAAAAVANDYVNASPLQPSTDGDVPWAYIASQGPLKHTRDTFWQMAVEQRCSAIVMLTNTVERGMQKCAAYFAAPPRTAKAFGRYTVSTLSVEQLLPHLERRSLAVKDTHGQCSSPLKRPLDGAPPHQQQQQSSAGQGSGGGSGGGGGPGPQPRTMTVQHYHYTAWPDHGVPSSAEPLLRLCAELHASGAHASPILVHCSAGIGRSGVFCVLDIATRRLLHLLEGEGAGSSDAAAAGAEAVDVATLVADLRRQRLGMVQTRDQYVFCHTALLHFVRHLAAERLASPRQGGQPLEQE